MPSGRDPAEIGRGAETAVTPSRNSGDSVGSAESGDAEDPLNANPLKGAGLYRLLIDSAQDYAIFALDKEGRILSWNTGAERLKGYTEKEIIGRNFSVFYPPGDIAAGKPERELREAAERGRIEDENWRIRKDGSRFWANVVISALHNPAGELIGYAKVTRDLTERRRSELQLRQSEERFRLLVKSVNDYAIFMLDPNGFVVSWNDGAERIKGYRRDEIIGRHFSTFYPAEDVAAGKPSRALEIAARVGKYEMEGLRVRKNGTVFWASLLLSAIRNESGQLIGFTKVTRDLTERRAAQERAIADARRIAEVEAANRTKSEFLRAMSHELRTPINATLGYMELIELGVAGEVTDQQRDYLTRMRASQEHLLGIITDLLNYSRVESGHIQYAKDAVPVKSAVATVIPMIEPQAASKRITLEINDFNGPLIAEADRSKVEQILLNLLANAVKFTPTRGRVSVSYEADDSSVRVAVSDTGPGISKEEQSSIFEPFVQVGRSLTSGHEGTGLGLAISRDLARAMGGDVTVESELRKGSDFTLSLPRGDERETEVDSEDAPEG